MKSIFLFFLIIKLHSGGWQSKSKESSKEDLSALYEQGKRDQENLKNCKGFWEGVMKLKEFNDKYKKFPGPVCKEREDLGPGAYEYPAMSLFGDDYREQDLTKYREYDDTPPDISHERVRAGMVDLDLACVKINPNYCKNYLPPGYLASFHNPYL